ncbi:ABC transporter ATP-binding protein [Donghicola tyrosinivorans]|uniref:Putative hydroxymethylpyrimidine transport system ATP-binding protein n=1 Tax=Donghicola tyrosinivorans TaxID=1652492 RepID=A0A2T0WPV2_9RHOB|nr:ABC transporter ATP-binding protein [Donghicola tyrosinivorans]PRY88722.1 putative hydroxymethylpyrimidine transport system ATP-binding protein [Donghicola tyrosinivorans]
MTSPALSLSGSASIGGEQVFAPLVFTVPAGQWTCLLGPSGVGKSTILRLFAGLDDGITFDGQITTSNDLPFKGRVSLMAQSDLLMPWLDLPENVCLGARLRGESADLTRACHLLTQVGLSDHLDKRPTALSGGQRQRVALARTLMEDRPIVLLDEPFSALDAKSRAQMQNLAADLLTGRTVLHVTHDTAEAARLADQVLLMGANGITCPTPPQTHPPRAFDAPETQGFDGYLLRLMLEAT